MKKLFLLLVYCCLQLISFSQPYDPEKVNKKARQLFDQAYERAQDGNTANAIGLLLQAVKTDDKFVDAYLALGNLYGSLKNYRSSSANYEKAFAIDPVYTLPDKLPYSVNLAGLGEFEKALAAVTELLDTKKPSNPLTLENALKRKYSYAFAVDYAKNNPEKNYVFAPQNMGDSINSAESEYFPSLTVDGKQLAFTRKLGGNNEDFFYSNKSDSGNWQLSKPMEGNVNTEQSEGAQNISQDGQWLVFTGCYRKDGYGGCDLYISYKTENGWSEAINLGPGINTDQWDAQPCLSPDKRELYFVSRRFGGYGGSDIYVCRIKPDGKWGEPENLGPGINSPEDEQCPFIHADNQTLYFTSSFWPGYGDEDLFYTRRLPNGGWTKPVNLGYPINTIDREGTLFIASDGKTAYYASDRNDTRGGLDIYSFELRENIRPFKTLWVKGKVFDKKTNTGLPSAVELIDLGTKKLMTLVETNEKGEYLITLPVGKDYAFNVNRKGYLFYSDNFSLKVNNTDTTYEKNIGLQPFEVNANIVLKNIFFDVNKFELKPESQTELDLLVKLLLDNPTVKIEIGGHTDNVGKPADNLALSNNRAKAVVNYLAGKNIPVQRLTAKGYGETKPVADNKTEAGRAINRRTELRVVSK
ncbi:MAG: OmpA family protein [Sphingobacteriales bacterium]|nr:OmpA family protein [Sphingobacteriales bacterium]